MLIFFILITALFSINIIANLLCNKSKPFYTKLDKLINFSFFSAAGLVLLLFVFHAINIFSNDFNYAFVYKYSSLEQSFLYKCSAVYTGASGSFLFWLLVVCAIGVFLQVNKNIKIQKNIFFAFYSFLPLILSIILINSSPFELTVDKYPELFNLSNQPHNGLGLNPILQTPYNLIHPPLIFIGFSMLYVQFVLAISSLISREYLDWQKIAEKYNTLGLLFLGLAIFLGAVWAYNSFGWGGFWNWDPIENAVLVPFILAFSSFYFFSIFEKTGAFTKTTYLINLLIFPFVIFSAFIARSGIFSNTSVHSYSGSSATSTVFYLILSFFILLVLYIIFLFLKNRKAINSVSNVSNINLFSKEMFLASANFILIAFTFVLLVGTYYPVFSGIELIPSFFLSWAIPLIFIYFVIYAFSMFMHFGKNTFPKITNEILLNFSISIISMIVLFFNGLTRIEYLLLAFSSILVFLSNIQSLFKNKFLNIYESLISIGLCIFVFFAMITGENSTTKIYELEKNKTISTLTNYEFNFKNHIEKRHDSSLESIFNIEVTKKSNGEKIIFSPKLVYKNNMATVKFPDVKMSNFTDLYISPIIFSTNTLTPYNILKIGEAYVSKVDKNTTLKLSQINKKNKTVDIIINTNNGTPDTIILKLPANKSTNQIEYYWQSLNEIFEVALAELLDMNLNNLDLNSAENKQVAALIYKEKNKPLPIPIEKIQIEFSIKPYQIFVWIGLMIFNFGLLLAFISKNMSKKINKI